MGDHIYVINFNFKFQKICGLWRDPMESRAYKIYRLAFYFVFFFIYLGSIVVGSLTANSVEEFFSDIMYIALTETAMVVKIVYGFINFTSILELHQRAIARDFQPTTDEEQRTSHKLLRGINIYFMFYLLWSSVGVWSHLTCLFDGQYKLPFSPWLLGIPYGKHLPYNYDILAIYQVNGMFFHAICNHIVDIQVGYLLTVAGLQLDCLLRQFSAIHHDQRHFHQQFKRQIEHYEAINDFVKQIERVYSAPVFCQFCANGITMCAIAYRMSSLNLVQDLPTVITSTLYLAAMMNQIYLPCYLGHVLTLKSEQLTNALYSSGWTQMVPKDRKDTMMMMIRSQRPIRIKAGGFYHYNLHTFTLILNMAYSLFCVLQRRGRKA